MIAKPININWISESKKGKEDGTGKTRRMDRMERIVKKGESKIQSKLEMDDNS